MKRLKKSITHALNGLARAIKSEPNFRLHCFAAIFVVLIGLLMEWEAVKWCLAILAIGSVLGAELMNTAIEYTWDHLEPNHHPVVAAVKDVMAGGVLIVALGAAAVGIILIFF